MIKRIVKYMAVTLLLAAASFAQVTINAPAPGSVSGSPVHFVASAQSSFPITAMEIYVDDSSAYLTYAGALDTFVPLSPGTHSVIVQAWDSTGAVLQTPETITVSSAGVAVSSPSDSSTVGSPIHVVASAAAPNPISAMRVYLDGVNMYTNGAANLDTMVDAAAGTHSLVVQAWDVTGAVYKQTLNVNVSGSSVPAGATVKSMIQSMPGWGSCTVCAGANANGPTADYSMSQYVTSPSLSGQSTVFNIGGATPYSDAIWWAELGPADAATHFQYDVDFYLSTPQYSEALEFDMNQTANSTRFVFGTQCGVNFDQQWDVWDTAGDRWAPTGVPCPAPAANQWHHLTWEYDRDAGSIHYIAVTLDGVKTYVNMTFSAKPWSDSPELNTAFQMDGDYAMHPYSVWLDNLTVTYW